MKRRGRNVIVGVLATFFVVMAFLSLPSPFPEWFTPKVHDVFTYNANVHVKALNITVPSFDMAVNITGKGGAIAGIPLTIQVYITPKTNGSYYETIDSATFWFVGSRAYPTVYNKIGYPDAGIINVTYSSRLQRWYGEGQVEYFTSGSLPVNLTFYDDVFYWVRTNTNYVQAVAPSSIPNFVTIASTDVFASITTNSVAIAVAWLVAALSVLLLWKEEQKEPERHCHEDKHDESDIRPNSG